MAVLNYVTMETINVINILIELIWFILLHFLQYVAHVAQVKNTILNPSDLINISREKPELLRRKEHITQQITWKEHSIDHYLYL